MGDPDLDRRTGAIRPDSTLGHQGSDASRDIRFANALPVRDGPAFVAYIRDVLIPEIEPGTAFGSLTRTNGVRSLTPR